MFDTQLDFACQYCNQNHRMDPFDGSKIELFESFGVSIAGAAFIVVVVVAAVDAAGSDSDAVGVDGIAGVVIDGAFIIVVVDGADIIVVVDVDGLVSANVDDLVSADIDGLVDEAVDVVAFSADAAEVESKHFIL